MSGYRVGDRVEWTSQAGGHARTKRGVVIEVVPPGRDPTTKRRGAGMYRDHESYVVRAVALGRASGEHSATYWPRAASLWPSYGGSR
jgi:hypothetical protein